jgi:predicted amidohydrolase
LLPEIFNYAYEIELLKKIAEDNNETLIKLQEAANKNKIYLCTGSIPEKVKNKIYNKSYLINPDGQIIHSYCKSHLFDVELPHLRVQESQTFSPGNKISAISTELGKIGILICYDIRFPETARKLSLSGVEIILVPAAFNHITGPAHWHVVFRARAIENQVYIAAAALARNNNSKYKAYGHSMIIDPWGKIISEARKKEEIIYADLNPDILKKVRAELPLLKHRRTDLY